jgi:hypothetical protein
VKQTGAMLSRRKVVLGVVGVAVVLQFLSAVGFVKDSYTLYSDACTEVPMVFFMVVPAKWLGMGDLTMPKNPTYCAVASHVVSPGVLSALVKAVVVGAMDAFWSFVWERPVESAVMGACSLFGLGWGLKLRKRKTFERRHKGNGKRVWVLGDDTDTDSDTESEVSHPLASGGGT